MYSTKRFKPNLPLASVGVPSQVSPGIGLDYPRHKMGAIPTPHCVPEDRRRADYFNRECRCITLNRCELGMELSRQQRNGADLLRMILDERPHLFAESPVFIDGRSLRRQAELIAAIEKVVAMPAFQERVLAYAPATAQFVPRAQGVFFSYDFHLDAGGPRLIEINSNAGGALLNALLARAQKGCGEWKALQTAGWRYAPEPEQAFLAMFLAEWRAERGDAPLRSIAIVDEKPDSQFLYPEFLLFQQLFERHGIDAMICDPSELNFREGALWLGKRRIDLVYNRLTDFALEAPANDCLREAYLNRAAVVTPHPRAHALYADKRNLALMTDEAALREMGVDRATIALLQDGIAHTSRVRAEDAEALWSRRKRLFFKPVAGYGGKAAYRGDKLTRRVFEEILQGDYVAQALVPPSERLLQVAGGLAALKLDLRHYVYCADIQLTAARLYQGQTTNFRTPGGGFAPVAVVPYA